MDIDGDTLGPVMSHAQFVRHLKTVEDHWETYEGIYQLLKSDGWTFDSSSWESDFPGTANLIRWTGGGGPNGDSVWNTQYSPEIGKWFPRCADRCYGFWRNLDEHIYPYTVDEWDKIRDWLHDLVLFAPDLHKFWLAASYHCVLKLQMVKAAATLARIGMVDPARPRV